MSADLTCPTHAGRYCKIYPSKCMGNVWKELVQAVIVGPICIYIHEQYIEVIYLNSMSVTGTV